MKRCKVFWGVCCAVLIAGCAIPLGEDYTLTRDGNDADSVIYITDYNLETYVPRPKPMEKAVLSVENREDLEASVVWKDAVGVVLPLSFETFADETVYQAEIILTPKPGYAFSSTPFAYHPGKIKDQIDDLGEPTRTVMVTYNPSNEWNITYITDYNLQTYVPIPMAGEKPVGYINTRADMVIEVEWKVEQSPGTFVGFTPGEDFTFDLNTVYQADIKLKVKDNYRFSPEKNFEYLPGAVAAGPEFEPNADPGTRVLINVTYLPTRNPARINDTNLTSYIPKPISGITPVWSFAAPQYTGTVTWKNTETQEVLAGPFQYGTEYTAELTLKAVSGYSFAGVEADVFTHTGAQVVTNPVGGSSVSIGFLPTSSAGGPAIVYDTDLTGRIPKPVHGVTPVASFAGSQYNGKVTWRNSETQAVLAGSFQSGVLYTAVVMLTPVSGYTFAGIRQNVFTHRDAKTVTNPAGSGTVTINFPPAGSLAYQRARFGPTKDAEDSALKLMYEKRFETDPITIELPEDIEDVFPNTAILAAGLTSPADVTIDGHNRTLILSGRGGLITVGGGVTLTLQHIILQGVDDENGFSALKINNTPLITIQVGGKLILGDGAVLTGNTTTAAAGGVLINGGEFIMNNGVIKKMKAGYNGEDNGREYSGGGVVVDYNGKFTMSDGIIGGETPADGNVGYGDSSGGGVLVFYGLFDMYGGAIQYNNSLDGDGEGGGGGVMLIPRGTFNQYGGTIKRNIANSDGSGGGVCVAYDFRELPVDARFTMNGVTAVIEENVSKGDNSAGGVWNGKTFIMIAGTIRNNRVENSDDNDARSSAGGVYCEESPSEGGFIMNGGTISGNEVGGPNSAGGVYGSLYMNGGTISGNRASGSDSVNGVYATWDFTMSGSAKVTEDNYVVLPSSCVITLGGNLSSEIAANIKCVSPSDGTPLLRAGTSSLLTNNVGKFRYEGDTDHINPSPSPLEGGYYYIKYQ